MSETGEPTQDPVVPALDHEDRQAAGGAAASTEARSQRGKKWREPATADDAPDAEADQTAPASTAASDAEAAGSEDGERSSIARAEVVMDQAGERVGALLLATGQRLRRVAALAREEAEDILAEARSIRHGGSTGNGNDQ